MRVTQQDIARIAMVSQATVSRVVAGDERVEQSLKARVMNVMRQHNYTPDVRARSLRSRRTGLIGLVINRPEGGLLEDPFFARLVSEITGFLSGRPFHLCLDMVSSDQRQQAIYDEMLRTRRVDGLILVESEAKDERIGQLQRDSFPFVLIGNPSSAEIVSVDNDNVLAGEMATRHLLDAGYRRVGFLGGRPSITVSDDRIAGYRRALIGRQAEEHIFHSSFGFHAANEEALKMLNSKCRPDSLVVLDDFMAMGVVLAARKLNLRVPGDLGLVSFNDSNVCDLLECGLTSVSLNISQIVRTACDLLLAIIEGESTSQITRKIVPCELVVRGSSVRDLNCPESGEKA